LSRVYDVERRLKDCEERVQEVHVGTKKLAELALRQSEEQKKMKSEITDLSIRVTKDMKNQFDQKVDKIDNKHSDQIEKLMSEIHFMNAQQTNVLTKVATLDAMIQANVAAVENIGNDYNSLRDKQQECMNFVFEVSRQELDFEFDRQLNLQDEDDDLQFDFPDKSQKHSANKERRVSWADAGGDLNLDSNATQNAISTEGKSGNVDSDSKWWGRSPAVQGLSSSGQHRRHQSAAMPASIAFHGP